MKKQLVALAVFAALAAPFVTHAVTAAELQVQIQSLLQTISGLQSQLQSQYQSGGVAAVANTVIPIVQTQAPDIGALACPYITQSLAIGSRDALTGGAVSSLQRYLIAQGVYPEALVSGYYGPLTAQAVARLQNIHGISPVGTFGPQTRALLQRLCGTISPPISYNYITVTRPAAGEVLQNGSTYTISWNDSRTYIVAPRYDIYLMSAGYPCTGTICPLAATAALPQYRQAIAQNVYGPYTWTVQGGGYGSLYTIEVCSAGGSDCASSGTFSIGTTAGNRPPVIQGFSGPTTLAIGQAGTWTINAHDPESGSLTYSIDWGDMYYPAYSAQGAYDAYFKQQSTFTHSYASLGTYTVTITVADSSGQSAQATATVQVGGAGGVACTLEYRPVCGNVAKHPCCVGPSHPLYTNACTFMKVSCTETTQRTYGNLCQLTAEGATFLHDGECNAGVTEAPYSCKVWYDGCNTCSRSYPGGPLACTLMACFQNAGAYCKESF